MSTIILDAGTWATLSNVNAEINRNTLYRTDLSLYGKVDFWAFANGEGDCEDVSLAKYRELIRLGYPREDLRLTLCFVDATPEQKADVEAVEAANHAVLGVITDLGRFIMDNRIGSLQHWQDPGFKDYTWIKALTPDGWVDLRANNPS